MPFLNSMRNLKSDILFRTIALFCLSMGCIVFYSYIRGKEAAIETATTFIEKLNLSSISETAHYLEESEAVAKSSASLFTGDFGPIQEKNPLILYMLSIVKNLNPVTSISYGSEEKFFISATDVRKQNLNSKESALIPIYARYSLRIIDYREGKEQDLTYYFDANLNQLSSQNSSQKLSSFFGFKWYKKASLLGKSSWSDIHLLHTGNLAGVTNSVPVYNPSGKLKGVISVDITTGDLSGFINEMRISHNSHVFIISEDGKIIADSEMREIVRENEKGLFISTVGDIGDENLVKALQYYESTKNKEGGEYQKRVFQIKGQAGKEYIASIMLFPSTFNTKWKVFSLTPIEEFTGNIINIQRDSVYISIFILLISIILIYFHTQSLSDPIIEIAEEADKIKHFEFSDPPLIKTNIVELHKLNKSIWDLKRTFTNFSKFIPMGLVRKLRDSDEEVTLGGTSHDLTIMFTDIEEFSAVSETLSAKQLMIHLSEYFDNLTKIIISNNGTIDKFIGDAIMAFWGAPDLDERQSHHACRAALLCQQKLVVLNKYWASINKPILKTRIGLNKGLAVVGNMGSSEQMNYTALGDNVNVAARLEGVNKFYGTSIIISESVKNEIEADYVTRLLDVVAVKGKTESVKIYELLGPLHTGYRLEGVSKRIQEQSQAFSYAVEEYLKGNFEKAEKEFLKVKKANDEKECFSSLSLNLYLERCQSLIKNPPKEWNGILVLHEK